MKPHIRTNLVKEHGSLDCFSQREREIFMSLKNPRRKNEWYWARMSAKRLLSDIYGVGCEEAEILNMDNREPYALVNGRKIRISLSHRDGLCGCAVSVSDRPVGFDIEKMETRNLDFFEEYLNENEFEFCLKNPGAFPSVWALKEASLKMLGLGLSVSAKEVNISGNSLSFSGKALEKSRELKMENAEFEIRQEKDWVMASVWA